MFTGIVEELGSIAAIERGSKAVRLTVSAQKVLQDVQVGDSIAVNGVCLTVVTFQPTAFIADVMPETVDKTVISKLHRGDIVNLERAVRAGDRLGGHLVSGHVDGIGIIEKKEKNENAVIVLIKAAADILRYIVMKGSIAVDGISLTVIEVNADSFAVSLIPHTAAATTLGFKNSGDMVNLETDIIAKYVEKMLLPEKDKKTPGQKKSDITRELLIKSGF